ncbi:MAG: hypothetical protein H6704_06055 [Myxococcales bacterium]|nr:hypothetical protein [Myxococcales bacterium]
MAGLFRALLLAGRRDEDALKSALYGSMPWDGVRQQLVEQLASALDGAFDDEDLGEDDFTALQSALSAALAQRTIVPDCVVERALVEALDATRGASVAHRLAVRVRGQPARLLTSGDLVPARIAPPAKPWNLDAPNSPPDRLNDAFDRTRHLLLFRQRGALEVAVQHHDPNLLPDFERRAHRVGVAVLNDTLADFAWDAYERNETPLFFGVRPTDSAVQWRRLSAVLDRAEAEGLDVLVLPELALCDQTLAATEIWMAAPGRRLALLAAGSVHRKVGTNGASRRLNRCVVLGQPTVRVVHDKFGTFRFDDGATHRLEDIDRHPRLTLHRAGELTFAVVICADFFEPDLHRTLADLRPCLLLVPAFSPRTQPFEGLIGAPTVWGQTLVAMANTSIDDAAAAGLFGRPSRTDWLVSCPRGAVPALHVFDTDGGAVAHSLVLQAT